MIECEDGFYRGGCVQSAWCFHNYDRNFIRDLFILNFCDYMRCYPDRAEPIYCDKCYLDEVS